MFCVTADKGGQSEALYTLGPLLATSPGMGLDKVQ